MWRAMRVKPRKSQRGCSIIEECRATSYKWLIRPPITNPQSGLVVDFSNWTVLKWWERYSPGNPNIVDLVRRQVCAQASSATSERAFSKAGLIIIKKRQRLTSDHVDGISLLGWLYKDKSWGESAKRPWCTTQVQGQRFEEGGQVATQEGFTAIGSILRVTTVHMHYDT